MAPKWMGLLVFVWAIGALVGGILEGIVVGENETTVLNQIMYWKQARSEESWNAIDIIMTPINFLSGIFRLLTFDFAFFQGPWELVRYICLSPIIATIVFGLILIFFSVLQRGV